MKASEENLGDLHLEVSKVLRNNLEDEDGRANSSILSLSIRFLKDNEITCSIADNQDTQMLSDALKAKRAKRKLRIVGEE